MFFFTQVLFKNDGTYDRSTAGYEGMDLAEQAFHTAMSSTIQKPEYVKAICFVYDDEGIIKFKRVWHRGS